MSWKLELAIAIRSRLDLGKHVKIDQANLSRPVSGGTTVLHCICRLLAVRPEGADHQWRENPPGELSIDPVADERLVWVTVRVGAS